MYWDEVNGTVSIKLQDGTTLNLGQELWFYGKAIGDIANGELIQFAGVQGDHITIKKVVPADVIAFPYIFIGVATQDIANGSYGKVTWFGEVGDIYTNTPANQDTLDWAIQDLLYMSNSTGQLTKTAPALNETRILVAAVIKTQTGTSQTGKLIVRPEFLQSTIWEGGTTLNRPVAPVAFQKFFDTTLNKPIWYNGSNWVDATGATV